MFTSIVTLNKMTFDMIMEDETLDMHVLYFHELHVNTFVLKVTMYTKEINTCLAFGKYFISGLVYGDCGKITMTRCKTNHKSKL
jgi:hypothetical protein